MVLQQVLLLQLGLLSKTKTLATVLGKYIKGEHQGIGCYDVRPCSFIQQSRAENVRISVESRAENVIGIKEGVS